MTLLRCFCTFATEEEDAATTTTAAVDDRTTLTHPREWHANRTPTIGVQKLIPFCECTHRGEMWFRAGGGGGGRVAGQGQRTRVSCFILDAKFGEYFFSVSSSQSGTGGGGDCGSGCCRTTPILTISFGHSRQPVCAGRCSVGRATNKCLIRYISRDKNLQIIVDTGEALDRWLSSAPGRNPLSTRLPLHLLASSSSASSMKSKLFVGGASWANRGELN